MLTCPHCGGLTVMGGFVFMYADLFPEAKTVVESDPEGQFLAEKWKHAKELWEEIILEAKDAEANESVPDDQ